MIKDKFIDEKDKSHIIPEIKLLSPTKEYAK